MIIRGVSKKMRRIIPVLIWLLISWGTGELPGRSSTIVDLKELENPAYMTAGRGLLLIGDNQRVRVYNLKNFKLIRTIGRRGEGPGEFRGRVTPQILPDSIMIGSHRKVSFFDFSGNLLKEQKSGLNTPIFKTLRHRFVSYSIKKDEEDFRITYDLYDSDFKKVKTLHKGDWVFHKNRTMDFFEIFFFDVTGDKIVFAHRRGFRIDILDERGDLLHSITASPPGIPFTEQAMNDIFNDGELNTRYGGFIQSLKKKGIAPEFFPAIRTCRLGDGKIYVVTYLKERGRSECLVYNMEGRLLQRTFIPLRDSSPLNPPPFTIKEDRLYQLVDHADKEVWQLTVDIIDL